MARTPVPEGITREDVLLAITSLKAGTVDHSFHDSERYDLVHEGERFPPKAVLGVAAVRVAGRLLVPADFSGGEGSVCFRILRGLGFTIEKKQAGNAAGGPKFVVGKEYNRRSEIHVPFGGQERGGISTPANVSAVFLFTGSGGGAFGYEDKFRDDGVFLYTGEGQAGDMKLDRGDLAIQQSGNSGRQLYLFEQTRKGFVRFVGHASYIGHHFEERLDGEGTKRKAIVFELEIPADVMNASAPTDEGAEVAFPKAKSLLELRSAAQLLAPRNLTPQERVAIVHYRSEAVKRYVLLRANGKCEGCENNAPFNNKKNQPYLEPHHTTRRADGGPDSPEHVVALCPNCHRRVHSGMDGDAFNQRLIVRVADIEAPYSREQPSPQ